MNIDEKNMNGVVALKLEGNLDASTAKDLREKVKSILIDEHINFVIDMGGIKFIDSSGLGSMVASLRAVSKVGGDIKVAALVPEVKSIFELTRLHRLFDIFDDTDAAIKSFH